MRLNKFSYKLGALVLLLLALTPIALFLFDEWQREHLLKNYQQTANLMKLPSQPSLWSIQSILQSNEVIVCVMDSYGRTDDFSELSSQQKLSAPKSKLPSQSGLWYMLFFSTSGVERVALWDYENFKLDFIESSCGNSFARFSITPHYLNAVQISFGTLSIKK